MLFAVADVFKTASQLNPHSLYSQQTTQIQLQQSLQLQYTLPSPTASRSYLFTQFIFLYPIRIKLSFKSNAQYPITASIFNHPFIPTVFKAVFDAAGSVITNIDNAVITLSSFEASNLYLNEEDIVDRIVQHYLRQAKVKIYRVLGAANILGNPAELVSNLGQGVKALIDESIQGVKQGPVKFIDGIGKGTKQLLSKTAFGLFNSVEKITDTLGNGVESLTMSDQYKADRAAGKTGILHGVKSGVTGLIQDITQSKGVIGKIEGVGKGAVGIITKPVGGILDDTSQLLGKMKDIARVEVVVPRVRVPRCVGFGDVLSPYDQYTAGGEAFMAVLVRSGLARSGERYVIHIPVSDNAQVLYFTTERVAVVSVAEDRVVWSGGYGSVTTAGSENHFLLMHAGDADKKRSTDVPAQCSFGSRTLMNLVQDFLASVRIRRSQRLFATFALRTCTCVKCVGW